MMSGAAMPIAIDAPHPLALPCVRRERPRRSRAAECGDEPPSSDCHLIRPRWDHARCNTGKNITHQSAGLALASVTAK